MSLNRGMDTENVYLYTIEYYSATKKNEFMKFLGKWMDLEGTRGESGFRYSSGQ